MLPDYRHGICLTNTKNNKVLIMLSARSEHDRKNFIDDLKETILEVRLYRPGLFKPDIL